MENRLKFFIASGASFAFVFVAIGVFHFYSNYSSAFEADRACHSLISQAILDNDRLGCDHDLETRQWILFSEDSQGNLIKIVKRFRY